MKPTRRDVVVAGGAMALAGCGRSELYDDEGLAASGPEDDDVSVIASKVPETTLPVHLTASATVPSNGTAGVNTVALKNPLGVAMEIFQVKWQVSGPNENLLTSNIFGGIIACKFDLGTEAITNGYVPIWSFCRPEDLGTETVAGDDGATSTCFFTWRLPRPLYIPAGAVLTPTFQHRGLIQSELDVRISYVGRSLLNRRLNPKKVFVPYVSSYVSPNFDFTPSTSVPEESESSETDLVNPHKDPLFLQRFTGRIQTYINLNDGAILASETVQNALSDTRIRVRMIDSNGRPSIETFTQFRQAFSGPTRSWDLDNGAMMDPNSYYRIFLKTNPVGLFWSIDPALITTAQKQAFVGVVGWREIGEG